MFVPIEFEQIASYATSRSPLGEFQDTLTTRFFSRALYERVTSLFKWDIPESWSLAYMNYVLISCGFCGVVEAFGRKNTMSAEKTYFGWIPQFGTFIGRNIFYEPTTFKVASSLIHEEYEIGGGSCEILKMTDDYLGLWDIIDHYADELANIWTSHRSSLVNSRLAYILIGRNKAMGETLKAIFEKIQSGDPAVITDEALIKSIPAAPGGKNSNDAPWFTFSADCEKAANVAVKTLEMLKEIVHQFDTEIGIPTVGSKKERMITDEVGMLTADSSSRVSHWFDNLSRSCDRVNAAAGKKIIGIAMRNEFAEGGDNNDGESNTLGLV